MLFSVVVNSVGLEAKWENVVSEKENRSTDAEKSLNLNFVFYIVTLAFIFTIFFLDFQQILKYC